MISNQIEHITQPSFYIILDILFANVLWTKNQFLMPISFLCNWPELFWSPVIFCLLVSPSINVWYNKSSFQGPHNQFIQTWHKLSMKNRNFIREENFFKFKKCIDNYYNFYPSEPWSILIIQRATFSMITRSRIAVVIDDTIIIIMARYKYSIN